MKPVESQPADCKMDAKSRKRPLGALFKCITALSPIPYLARVRDYYVRSITQCGPQCAGLGSYVGIMGVPGMNMAFTESFTCNSSNGRDSDHDYRELVRAASQRGRPKPIAKLSDHQPLPRSFSASNDHRRRRQQIGFGRIDEESPCYFSGSFRKTHVDENLQFLRSRSCSTVQNLNTHERKKIAL